MLFINQIFKQYVSIVKLKPLFIALFRAIFNALKYAGVYEVEVTIQQTEEGLIAEIIDRGKGFDPNLKPQGTGLGLYGMNERAELVKGTVNIETHIGKGTIITLEVPV